MLEKAKLNFKKMLYVYHYSSEAFLTLLPISVVILILAGTGNIFILRQSYKRYRAKKFVSDLLIFACCMCNIVTCFLGLPLHIVKLVVDHFEDKKTSSYLCVFRYGIISSTTNYSLLMLTVLILSRKDKILQISAGKNSLIHKKNVMGIIFALMLISLVPQLATSILHLTGFLKGAYYPCRKPAGLKKQMIVNITGKAVMFLIATPSIALIVRTISQLKTKVKLIPERNRTLKRSINKLNISFMYAGVFFIFWMPFGIMSAYSHNIKKAFYNTWYNIGYTLSFGYVLFLPIIFVLTDKNIQTNLKKNIKSSYSRKWKKKLEIEKVRNNNRKDYFSSYEFSTSDNTVAGKE